jgi:CheY-like chemotaxis protein
MSRTPAVYDIVTGTAYRGPAFNFSEMNLMVVDGTHSFRRMVARVLQRFGFQEVYEASDGEQALDILRTHHVDIVMTEWDMRPITGYHLIQRLRHDPQLADPEMRLIMLTGLSEKARVIAARDAGVDGFLRKPVSPDTLFKRIVSVIEHPVGLTNMQAASSEREMPAGEAAEREAQASQ